MIFSADETADVGSDLAIPVVERNGSNRVSKYTGRIPRETVKSLGENSPSVYNQRMMRVRRTMPNGTLTGVYRWPLAARLVLKRIVFCFSHVFVFAIALTLNPGMTQALDEVPSPIEKATTVPGYINTLLVDKTMPLLGGKWHGDIFVDVPLLSLIHI